MPQALCQALGDTDKNILLTVPLYPQPTYPYLTTCLNFLLSYPFKPFISGEKKIFFFKAAMTFQKHLFYVKPSGCRN